jgi:hypothetical protein
MLNQRKRRKPVRNLLAFILLAVALNSGPVRAEQPYSATLYKNPQCGCCEGYADHLRDNGFEVTVKPTHNLPLLHRPHDPDRRYVVEGHVPVNTVIRLLTERPDIKGISLPGMPMGSPGMTGEKTAPFTIYEIGDGPAKVYAVELAMQAPIMGAGRAPRRLAASRWLFRLLAMAALSVTGPLGIDQVNAQAASPMSSPNHS